MGNCCENYVVQIVADAKMPLNASVKEDPPFPTNPLEHPEESFPSVLVPTLPEVPSVTNIDWGELHLKKHLSAAELLKMENFLFDQIDLHKKTMVKVVECSSDELFEGELYGENISKPDSFELINCLFQNFKCNFKAEFVLFTYLNQRVYLSPSISDYELIKMEAYENEIYFLERLRTERIIVIAPRNMLTIRVVRKLGPNRFMDSSQSIEFQALRNHPTIKSIWEEKCVADPATPIIAGNYFEDRGKHSYACSFSKVDMHFSIPFKFAIIFLRSMFLNFVPKMTQNLKEHFTEDVWNTQPDLIWFKDKNGKFIEPNWVQSKEQARFFTDMNEFFIEFKKPLLVNEKIRTLPKTLAEAQKMEEKKGSYRKKPENWQAPSSDVKNDA